MKTQRLQPPESLPINKTNRHPINFMGLLGHARRTLGGYDRRYKLSAALLIAYVCDCTLHMRV